MTEEREKKIQEKGREQSKKCDVAVGDSSLICPHPPPICHGVKNHTTRTVPINARRVDLLALKR